MVVIDAYGTMFIDAAEQPIGSQKSTSTTTFWRMVEFWMVCKCMDIDDPRLFNMFRVDDKERDAV